jgi:hypothetical protein
MRALSKTDNTKIAKVVYHPWVIGIRLTKDGPLVKHPYTRVDFKFDHKQELL